MAGQADNTKGLANLVKTERVMREVYDKTRAIQTKQWPEDWGFIVPIYQEMYKELDQGQRQELPEKKIMVNREDFARYEPKPEDIKPVPVTNTKMYGWKVGNSIVESTDHWIKPHPKLSMYKELGWHWDSQH